MGLTGTRRIVILVLLLMFSLPLATQAQTPTLKVNLKDAVLSWTWTQGTEGLVDEFRMLCNAISHVVGGTARSVGIFDFITAPGTYTCAVRAANAFGVSDPSNSVSFDAGLAPNAPGGLIIGSPIT